MFVNNFDPVAFILFGVEIRWYSLAYIFGLIFAIQYGKFLIKRKSYFDFETKTLDDYLPFAILGIILGGRIGYILFYDLPVLAMIYLVHVSSGLIYLYYI